MSDLANLLRVTAREMAEHDEPPSWHHPIVEAADEIEKLRAENAKLKEALQLYSDAVHYVADVEMRKA